MYGLSLRFSLCTWVEPGIVRSTDMIVLVCLSLSQTGLRLRGGMLDCTVCCRLIIYVGFISRTRHGGSVGVARATSPSHDVTCSLSERGSSHAPSRFGQPPGSDQCLGIS